MKPIRGDIVIRIYDLTSGEWRIVVERYGMHTLFTTSDYDVVTQKLKKWGLKNKITPLVWMKYPGKDHQLVEHWDWRDA